MKHNADLSPEILELLASGHKVEAIKRIRTETGLGLKEAKDLAETLSGPPVGRQSDMPGMQEEGGAGSIVAIVTVILGVILLYVLFLTD
jgi:Ribosomal protein L7/L12 C-terminal domain